MFENISFITTKIPEPVTLQSVDLLLAEQDNLPTYVKVTPQEIVDIQLMRGEMQGLEFCLSGMFQSVRLPPISQYAQKNLYYLCGFTIYHMDSNFFTFRTFFPYYILLYTYRGHGCLDYEGKTYHLGAGDGFFIDGRKPHLFKCSGDEWVYGIIDIQGPNLSELYTQFAANHSPIFVQPMNGSLQTGLEKLLEIYSTVQPYRDWQANLTIETFLTDLLVDSLNAIQHSIALPQNMQYLIRYIEENYTHPLTVEDLSRYSGISRAHLSREFNKYTGYSPIDYLIQIRLNAAKHLLATTNLSVSTIAYEVGFRNINNFNTLFKKYVQQTPSSYRSIGSI